KIAAKENIALGFNWTYSPDADVNNNPRNPVIGVRSFGEQTDLVSEMTVAQVVGYQEEGIIATAKHFPGHGDTETDSHHDLPTVTYDFDELEEKHLPPFQAAIDAGIDSIMTAHVIVEAIDPELPATLSKDVLTGLLREDMEFDGLIVTDAMGMQAIDANWGAGDAAVMSIQAGADIILAEGPPEDQLETYDALYDAYQSGELTEERVQASLERILTKKFEYNLFDNRFVDPYEAKAFVGNQKHQELANQIALDSMTLVKNEDILPFDEESEESTFIAGVTYVNAIADRVQQQSKGEVITWQASSQYPTDEEIRDAVMKAEEADRIIVPTYSLGELPEGQSQLVEKLKETGKPTVAVSLGLPYDVQNYPDVDAYIASYALDNWQLKNFTSVNAAIDVVFGEQPGGQLPVTIEGHYPYGHGLHYAPTDASDIKNLVEVYERKDAFKNDEAVHTLKTHLTAVKHYEEQEKVDKVVKHLEEGFKDLLNYQKDNELISKKAYQTLMSQTDE